MTSTLFACYREPADRAAFDRHYEEVHQGLGLALPGLQGFTGSHTNPLPDGSAPPYYFIAVLTFPDDATMNAALTGEEGKAAVADLATFADGGVDLVTGSTVSYT